MNMSNVDSSVEVNVMNQKNQNVQDVSSGSGPSTPTIKGATDESKTTNKRIRSLSSNVWNYFDKVGVGNVTPYLFNVMLKSQYEIQQLCYGIFTLFVILYALFLSFFFYGRYLGGAEDVYI